MPNHFGVSTPGSAILDINRKILYFLLTSKLSISMKSLQIFFIFKHHLQSQTSFTTRRLMMKLSFYVLNYNSVTRFKETGVIFNVSILCLAYLQKYCTQNFLLPQTLGFSRTDSAFELLSFVSNSLKRQKAYSKLILI